MRCAGGRVLRGTRYNLGWFGLGVNVQPVNGVTCFNSRLFGIVLVGERTFVVIYVFFISGGVARFWGTFGGGGVTGIGITIAIDVTSYPYDSYLNNEYQLVLEDVVFGGLQRNFLYNYER